MQIYPFLITPLLTAILGCAIAAWRVPGAGFRGLLQQGTAGLMFATVGGIVLPRLVREQALLPLLGGCGGGAALVLSIRVIAPRFKQQGEEATIPITEVATAAIAYWASGLFIGAGFATGFTSGALIALAVTSEILALSVLTVTQLRHNEVSRMIAFALTCTLALLIGAGLSAGIVVSNLITGPALYLVLAFAAATLLCVVVESVRSEAASTARATVAIVAFSFGSLALFMIKLVLGTAT